jgi:hypothetical protein
MLSDKLQVVRAQRQVRLAERLADFLKERGLLNGPTRSIAPNFAVPLIEHATLEEDDELQDVWARMLAVAADAGSEVEMRTAYIRMLADMTAFDVRVLARVARNGRATLALLPDGLLPGDTAEERAWNEQKRSGVRPTRHATHEAIWTAKFRPDVMISIGNLNRLTRISHKSQVHRVSD